VDKLTEEDIYKSQSDEIKALNNYIMLSNKLVPDLEDRIKEYLFQDELRSQFE